MASETSLSPFTFQFPITRCKVESKEIFMNDSDIKMLTDIQGFSFCWLCMQLYIVDCYFILTLCIKKLLAGNEKH